MPQHNIQQNIINQTNQLHNTQHLIINTNHTQIINQLIKFLHHQHINAHLTKIIHHHQPNQTNTNNHHLNTIINNKLNIKILYYHFNTSQLKQNIITHTIQHNLFY